MSIKNLGTDKALGDLSIEEITAELMDMAKEGETRTLRKALGMLADIASLSLDKNLRKGDSATEAWAKTVATLTKTLAESLSEALPDSPDEQSALLVALALAEAAIRNRD